MQNSNIIHFQGVDIYYMDFSNMKEIEAITKKIEEHKDYIASQGNDSVNALTNFDNIVFNKEIYQAFIEFIKENKPYIRRSAIIGLNGLVRLMVNGAISLTKRNLHLFESEEEAKNYLAN